MKLENGNRDTVNRDTLKHLYLRRGRAYELRGEYDKALQNYDELENIAREGVDSTLKLAALVDDLLTFRRRIFMRPDVIDALYLKASALTAQGNNTDCHMKTIKGLGRSPDRARHGKIHPEHFGFAQCKLRRRRPATAKHDL